MKKSDIHIGQLIKTVVDNSGMRSADLARKIGKSRQNVQDMYKRSDMEVKLLLTVSIATEHNFFEDIYPSGKSVDESIDIVFDTLKEIVKEKSRINK